MQKWTICACLSLSLLAEVPLAAGDENLDAKRFHHRSSSSSSSDCCLAGPTGPTGPTGPAGSNYEVFASYYFTNDVGYTTGENIIFNLQGTLSGIEYDQTTGVFTLSPGVYVINAISNGPADVNLVVNGTMLPNPNQPTASYVVNLTLSSNTVSYQAASSWSPTYNAGAIDDYFGAGATIAITQIGS